MIDEIKKEVTLVRTLIILLIIAIAIHLFTVFWQFFGNFSDIIFIGLLAWLLSFIIEPIVDGFTETLKISKTIATAITFLLIFIFFVSAILLFIPLVTSQIQTLTKVLPPLLDSTPPFINRFGDTIVGYISNSLIVIPSIAQFLVSTIVVLVISFYITVDKDRLNEEIFYLAPNAWHEKIRFLQHTIHTTFASFLRVQVIIGILTGIATFIILQLMGIEFAAAIAFLSAILAFIPLIGPILAVIPPLFVTIIVDPMYAIITLIALIIVQQFIFNIFVPRALGKAFSMHPVIILISSIIGFKVGGAIGAVFAIPLLGISAVILRDVSHHFITSKRAAG